MEMNREEMAWDLSQLVEKTDTASIQKRLEFMVTDAENIRDTYRNKINTLNAPKLLDFLRRKDAFVLKFEGVNLFCRLLYSADSTDKVAKQLNDAVRRAFMKANQAMAFIDIELGKLLAEKPALIDESVLAEFKHYLERILRRVPHMLTETQERLIIMKDKNGINAWSMLQNDWLSTRTFKITVKGEALVLPYGKIIGFYQSQDRNIRKQTNQIVYEGLGKDEIVWASAIRAVCEDHLEMCKLRRYPDPMTQSLIDNDIDHQTIKSLMKTIRNNVALYRRYLKLKAKLMNLEKLANYDLMAPLPKSSEAEYTWKAAQGNVTEAYMKFDNEIGEWVNDMFDKDHIDGEVRKGKESGAFCAPWLSGKSAYILHSFNQKMGDVYTLAHELGHAIHAYIGSRTQKPSNLEIGSCIAETGSIFSELLLTEQLINRAKTREEKQTILAHVLDEFGMAAFQVSARVFFEQSMYEKIKKKSSLDGETISKLWMSARDEIYGDSVDWLDSMKWEWTMKPHYYIPNYRFYNYPYVFAQLFVFALYRIYKENGYSFIPKLKGLLAAGSSKPPRELAAELGFDITDEAFWEKGMKQAEEFIDTIEKTL